MVIIGSTEQLWVFEDGVLITKTVIVNDANGMVGAFQLAFDEIGEPLVEQWTPASVMGSLDPEDPQWEMSYPDSPIPDDMQLLLASCGLTASFDACSSAVAGMVLSGVGGAVAAGVCVKFAFGPACWFAKNRGKHFVAMAIAAIATCVEWEMHSPALPKPTGELHLANASDWSLHLA